LIDTWQGFSKVPIFPSPHREKEGKCGASQHPAKGRLPLGTLLSIDFRKALDTWLSVRAIKNIQVLIVLDVIVNLL
jgi:hypothetical protein